jgi:hypothetical protein
VDIRNWSADDLRSLHRLRSGLCKERERSEGRTAEARRVLEYQLSGHEELLQSLRIQHAALVLSLKECCVVLERLRLGFFARLFRQPSIIEGGTHYGLDARPMIAVRAEKQASLASLDVRISKISGEAGVMRASLSALKVSFDVQRRVLVGHRQLTVGQCLDLSDEELECAIKLADSAERHRQPSRPATSVISDRAQRPPAKRVVCSGKLEPFLAPKVYVLRLEGGNFYVGRCRNFKVRIGRHLSGMGAKWTRMHRPIAVEAIFIGDVEEEKAVTLHYMATHGINRVRGWVFCKGGSYDESAVAALIRGYSRPVEFGAIPRSKALKPQLLEAHPDWETNRRAKGGGELFRDERGY